LTVPIYKYRLSASDVPTYEIGSEPTSYKSVDCDYLSTNPNLEDCDFPFRSYEKIGIAGYYQLDGRWSENHLGYLDNGKRMVDLNSNDLAGMTPEEGVLKIIYIEKSKP
jgi:hypothetical protein